MINRMKCMFSRLAAQFLKPTLAILAALAVGGARADYFWGDSAEGTWGTGFSGSSGNYVLNSAKDVTVNFDSSYSIASGVWIESGTYTVTFKGASTDVGLNMTGSADDIWVGGIHVGGWGGNGNLVIDGGSYTIPNALFVPVERKGDADDPVSATFELKNGVVSAGALVLGREETCQGTATLSGGTFSTSTVYVDGGSGTLTFNGGTLQASAGGTLIDSGVTVTVDANGGTIDTNGKAITIASSITGSGMLTITGGGAVTFTAAPACQIYVADGVAVLPEGAATTVTTDSAKGHTGTIIEVGENGATIDTTTIYDVTYDAYAGSGTLRIVGSGIVRFTTAPTCALEIEKGVVVLPGDSIASSITVGAHGALAFDLTGETITSGSNYTLASGVTSLTIPSGESYADSIFTIGPDFTSTITLDGTTLKATATSDATGNTRTITTCTLNDAWIDNAGGFSSGAPNDPTTASANYDTSRRDILVVTENRQINFWAVNTPHDFTIVVRGATLTLNSGDTANPTTLRVENIFNTGNITGSNSFSLTVNNAVISGGTVSFTNGTLTFPAGSTFADISATTVKVTGTVTGTTVAADGTIGAGSPLFTLTGTAPTFANSTVTVSIDNDDTAIHYTKGGNGVYTAGKVFYWISNSTANTTSNPDNYVEYDYCWSTTEGGAFVEGERPLYCDTAIFNKSGKSAMTHSDMPYNIKVMSDFYFHSKDKSSKETDGRTVGVSGLTTFFVANDATAYISVDAGSWYNNTKLVSTVLGGNRSRIVAQGYATNSSIRFNGDMSSYEGVVDIRIADNQRGSIVGIYEGALDSKYTRWYVSTNGVYAYRSDNNAPTMFKSEGTFKMGLLRAYISDSHNGTSSYANKNVVLELGENLDEDSWLANSWARKHSNYGGTVKWLAKTATFTNAVANAYEVDVMGGGNVYVMKNTSLEEGTIAYTNVPSVVKFLAYTSGDNDVRGGGYITLDGSNSTIAEDIINAIAVAGDGETQVATGFNVEAVEGGVSANVTKSAVLNNAVGFKKKGAGALTLSGAFTKLGVVNVTEGSLVIVATSALAEGTAYTCAADTACTVSGTTYTFGPGVATFNTTAYPTLQSAVDAAVSAGGGTVTLIANVEENVLIEAAGVSIVLGDYTITGTVTSSEDYDIVYDENTKTWTSSETANFIWCGGNGTSWNTPGNWKKGSVPGETDTVVFPTTNAEGGWTVALGEERTVASVQFDGKVTLIGAYLKTAAITGAGMIVLGDDAGLKYSGEAEVANPIEIAGTAGHPNKLYADGVRCIFSGPLSGAGDLELVASTDGMGVVLKGLNTMTSGTITVRAALGGGKRNASAIYSKASSAAVSWQIENGTGNRSDYKWNWLAEGDKEYVFGSVGNSTINTPNGTKNAVLTIGGLGQTDSLAGWFVVETTPSREWNTSYSRITIKKVGSGVLSVSSHSVYDYEIAEGVLELSADHARPAPTYGKVKFSGNGTLKLADAFTVDISENIAAVTDEITCPIVVDIGTASSVARIWDTAIPANYTGGFTKKGAGTLTLSQPPAYTGTTTVEAGTLIVPDSATLTLGANTIVSARDANTITLANATTVNITGLTHAHATATVTAGGESVTVNEGVAVVPVGSNVVITWAPASGYQITANETENIEKIREAVVATPPTVSELPTVSIAAPVVGAYGNDFATVSVTAGVTSTYPAATMITYTLKANGTEIASTTAAGNATSVTFDNANVSSLTRYGNISYTVEASGESVTAATSGATTAMLADAEGWIDEKKSTTGTTGSWKTTDGAAATVTYDDETERAELSDNKFSANNCSTGDVVTVTIKDVIYTALSDTSTVDGDAQGSIALGGTESEPKFMVLTKSGDTVQWSEASGIDPALNTSYTIVFTFAYTNNTYSITVDGTALTVGGSATYGIVKTDNKYVKDIDFLGAGSIKAIEGIQYDAMMAVDQDGVRYATVADALNANKGVKGAIIKLLHGTSNTNIAGWRFDEATMSFIKKAMGMVFLAF